MKNTNNYPLVTIIASCYNQDNFVIESLDSIKAQTYPNIELIIWDDCSTDNSVKTIDAWIENNHINCKFIRHNENKGICKSLNEAFGNAKGKYLQLIALDDILLQDKIERHVEILEKTDETIALVFSDAYLIDKDGNLKNNYFLESYRSNLELNSGNFMNELLIGNFIPAMSVLYKIDIINQVGLWDEKLHYEDYDMLLRLANKYDFILDKQMTVKYRLHDTNLHKTHVGLDIKYKDFWILIKHTHFSLAHEKVIEILKSAYLNDNRNVREMAKAYFLLHKPVGFFLYCIYLNIPLSIYMKIKSVIFLFR
jgi:glycosyltransferase involved in cell wall biosynthesis